MIALLAATPILVAVLVLVLGRPATWAAAAALVTAAAAALLAFRTPAGVLAASGADYAPLLAEVLLILLFGMILARLLEATGAMALLSRWLQDASTSVPAGTALVVFGVVPFAESVTGFGIGITVGIPILRRLGHRPAPAALLGLLGLTAVPWGALGPGTAVAASLTGLGLDELGVATAWVNALPVAVAVVAVAVLCGARRDPRAAVPVFAAGAVLWAGVLGANILVGTPPAGVLGSLSVILVLLLSARLRGARLRGTRRTVLAAVPYLVLTCGLLAAQALAGLLDAVWLDVLASPPVWLLAACLVAVPAAPGPVDGPAVVARAARAWVPVGVATGLFMMLGWLMTATGMSAAIGAALAVLGNAPGPLLLALGGIVAGSNTGANAMFAGTVASLAESTGASVLGLVAVGNAAAAFANIATPPRVALAVQVGAGDEALGAKSAAGNDSAEGSEGAQPADAGAQRAELERAVVRVQRATVLCVLAATVPLAVLATLL
ncbi:lactate permease [Brevibacterium pityocampae]